MRLVEHASPHVSSPPVADKASHGRSPSGTHHASGGLSMCKRTPMPLDWMHTGGGGPGSWPSPVDRSSHGPVYGLPPRSTRWAFSWRPLGRSMRSSVLYLVFNFGASVLIIFVNKSLFSGGLRFESACTLNSG